MKLRHLVETFPDSLTKLGLRPLLGSSQLPPCTPPELLGTAVSPIDLMVGEIVRPKTSKSNKGADGHRREQLSSHLAIFMRKR
jgi:hypothetical protein